MFRKKCIFGLRLRGVIILCVLMLSLFYSFIVYRNHVVQTGRKHILGKEIIRRPSSSLTRSTLKVDRVDTRVNGSGSSSIPSTTQVDIVYTWVNGSDPKFTAEFESFMYQHFNEDRNNVRSKTILLDIMFKENTSMHELAAAYPVLQHAKRIFPLSLKGKSETFTAVEFTDVTSVSEAMETQFRVNGKSISSIPCFYTNAASNVEASIKLSNQILMKGLRGNKDSDKVMTMLPKDFHMFIDKIEVYSEKDIAVLDVPDKGMFDKFIKMSVSNVGEDFPKLDAASFVCNTRKFFKAEETQAKRFGDYGGLKYSLRALEKHAPWIRHVFIVTNGQIPNWLNLANTQVSVVTHKEIFQDGSHLPTFASPAIESHLHRIPGLSDKFIYINDDSFFGKNVSLEDFYSDSAGEKLRLIRGTRMENCDIKCLPNMVGNGVCDTVCNNKPCEWDGEDCGGEPADYVARGLPYTSSLYYTNAVYNRYFGYGTRQWPEHGPVMVDKHAMTELRVRFPNEWELTSEQHIRGHKGMQYSFAYLYFLIESSTAVPMIELFKDTDVDDSKVLSKSELQTMATKLNNSLETIVTLERLLIQCSNGSPTPSANVTDAKHIEELFDKHVRLLIQCSNGSPISSADVTDAKQIEELFDKHVPQVTRYMFTHCRDFAAFVKSNLPPLQKYKYEIIHDNALLFTYMTNNIKENIEKFKNVRLNPRKFVCVNDAIQYGNDNIEAVISNIQEEYETIFPEPSKFELPVPN